METKKHIFREHLAGWCAARKDKKRRGEIIPLICFADRCASEVGAPVVRAGARCEIRHMWSIVRGRSGYRADVTATLKEILKAASYPCGENLHTVIAEYMTIITRDGMRHHGTETTKFLA